MFVCFHFWKFCLLCPSGLPLMRCIYAVWTTSYLLGHGWVYLLQTLSLGQGSSFQIQAYILTLSTTTLPIAHSPKWSSDFRSVDHSPQHCLINYILNPLATIIISHIGSPTGHNQITMGVYSTRSTVSLSPQSPHPLSPCPPLPLSLVVFSPPVLGYPFLFFFFFWWEVWSEVLLSYTQAFKSTDFPCFFSPIYHICMLQYSHLSNELTNGLWTAPLPHHHLHLCSMSIHHLWSDSFLLHSSCMIPRMSFFFFG